MLNRNIDFKNISSLLTIFMFFLFAKVNAQEITPYYVSLR